MAPSPHLPSGVWNRIYIWYRFYHQGPVLLPAQRTISTGVLRVRERVKQLLLLGLH